MTSFCGWMMWTDTSLIFLHVFWPEVHWFYEPDKVPDSQGQQNHRFGANNWTIMRISSTIWWFQIMLWAALLGIATQRAFAASFLDPLLPALDTVDGPPPSFHDLVAEIRYTNPPSPSRLPPTRGG